MIAFAFHFHSGEHASALMRLRVAAARKVLMRLNSTGIASNTGAAFELRALDRDYRPCAVNQTTRTGP
jgi:hypothetical protein